VTVVLRDKKASASSIQRRRQIGHNHAVSIMERVDNEGIVAPFEVSSAQIAVTARERPLDEACTPSARQSGRCTLPDMPLALTQDLRSLQAQSRSLIP
jgi:hypothetical protein